MFSFFTPLDTNYFFLLAIFSFPVIIYTAIEIARQENLMKMYDLFNYFQSLLFVCRNKIVPKDRNELLFL